METWRIIATALFAAAQLALVLFVMAHVRERTDSFAKAAIAGAVVLAASLIVGVLMVTVLAPWLAWTFVVVAGVTVTVMVLAS
ncbi:MULTISPECIES: hypothetical protein [Thermocrispum]|jgi:hypothetical protein|uniref:hypothetical protein n=1 Tax=Thermocrispum TaxID=37924 RepID=UPI00048E6E2B|nr:MULTISPECIES: hypothetical protein [Thermocrispum]